MPQKKKANNPKKTVTLRQVKEAVEMKKLGDMMNKFLRAQKKKKSKKPKK